MSVFLRTLRKIIWDQLILRLPYPQTPAIGQTVIVTGANVGLGFEAARHYVRLGADKVILAVRTLEKGEAAKKAIEESVQRKGVVEVWHLDLESYDSVKQFAEKVQGLPRLDIMLENAGIAPSAYRRAEENESTITVNVVSTFLLALLVLPKLRETSSKFNTTPYLTVVTSEVHIWTKLPERSSPNIFDTLSDEKTADMLNRFASSVAYFSGPVVDDILDTTSPNSSKSSTAVNSFHGWETNPTSSSTTSLLVFVTRTSPRTAASVFGL